MPRRRFYGNGVIETIEPVAHNAQIQEAMAEFINDNPMEAVRGVNDAMRENIPVPEPVEYYSEPCCEAKQPTKMLKCAVNIVLKNKKYVLKVPKDFSTYPYYSKFEDVLYINNTPIHAGSLKVIYDSDIESLTLEVLDNGEWDD